MLAVVAFAELRERRHGVDQRQPPPCQMMRDAWGNLNACLAPHEPDLFQRLESLRDRLGADGAHGRAHTAARALRRSARCQAQAYT
jgi:hypothetical protein